MKFLGDVLSQKIPEVGRDQIMFAVLEVRREGLPNNVDELEEKVRQILNDLESHTRGSGKIAGPPSQTSQTTYPNRV